MMLAATDGGLFRLEGDPTFADRRVGALAQADGATFVLIDGHELWEVGEAEPLARVKGLRANCLAAAAPGLLVGTSEAHLLSLVGGQLLTMPGFEAAEGRSDWYTPWGGPPDSRSIAVDLEGPIYVNVHVGGILRSADGGTSWEPTLDIHADVHQVATHPSRSATVLAASARGLGISRDGARSWTFLTDGLHASYLRAVAVGEDVVLVSASPGPSGNPTAIYRWMGKGPLQRCREGLPEWFTSNIDSHCLAAAGGQAALGTGDGRIFLSDDLGESWEQVAAGLLPVRAVAFGP